MTDPVARFSSRVENYAKFRPGYPTAIIELLQKDCGLTPAAVVADIGSGTGKLTELFLDFGNKVFAVEPNERMREAAEATLGGYQGFVSVNGAAEETTIANASVEFVVAGQAFHWFDQSRSRTEFKRILKSGGWVALIWNERLTDSTPFLRVYEDILLRYGTDYMTVRHENVRGDIPGFFAPAVAKSATFLTSQEFDLAGLRGRVASSSYTPEPGHENYGIMMAALADAFTEHAEGGKVAFQYHTTVHYGQLDTN